MGYYSTMNFDCRLKDREKIDGLLAAIKLKMAAGTAEDWEIEFSCCYTDEYNYLLCYDYYQKWYNEKKWIKVILPYLEDGEIEFIGDAGSRWGYIIEQGKAYKLEYIRKKGELLT